jgi:hypothetical protein
MARKVAFRVVNKRPEKDYNELVHNTNVIKVDMYVSQAIVDYLKGMN